MKVALHQACFPQRDLEWNWLPPLGLGNLVSYSEQHVGGIEFAIFRYFEDLLEYQPDLVCISYTSFSIAPTEECATKAKKVLGRNVPVLVGGVHISTAPQLYHPDFDIAILGEGEITFAELMKVFKQTGKFDPRDLSSIDGIIYRDEEGMARSTRPRSLIKNLDILPPPDRSKMYEQWKSGISEAHLMTTRGCPYDCSFCSTVQHWGTNYRQFSNEYVIKEIEGIINAYDPTTIHIFDDLFNVKRNRTFELLRMIRYRGLHHGRRYTCFSRPNLLDEETMKEFAQTNMAVINVGFESGSDNVLGILKKRSAGVGINKRVVELARKYDIQIASCFILGTPGETRSDIIDTFQFVINNRDVFFDTWFVPLYIAPGTPMWNIAKSKGHTEEELANTTLQEKDMGDEDQYFAERWLYLNEELVPRKDILEFLELGKGIENIIRENARNREQPRNRENVQNQEQTTKLDNITHVADNIPFSGIVKEKAKRRLSRILPIRLRDQHAKD